MLFGLDVLAKGLDVLAWFMIRVLLRVGQLEDFFIIVGSVDECGFQTQYFPKSLELQCVQLGWKRLSNHDTFKSVD